MLIQSCNARNTAESPFFRVPATADDYDTRASFSYSIVREEAYFFVTLSTWFAVWACLACLLQGRRRLLIGGMAQWRSIKGGSGRQQPTTLDGSHSPPPARGPDLRLLTIPTLVQSSCSPNYNIGFLLPAM
jgi:hypothetical protein